MLPKLVSRRISPRNLARLDDVAGIEPGAVSLHATDLDKPGYERLARFLGEHGDLLRVLKLEPRQGFYEHAELQDIDFTADCPHLRVLEVRRVAFNESVFTHPTLTELRLRESKYVGGPALTIGGEQPLRKLEIEDCQVKADRLAIAPDSVVKTFRYYLDEDYAEACPDNFDLYGERLEEMSINACWTYTVSTNHASERRNRRRRSFRAGQYGSVTHIYYRSNGEKVVWEHEPQDG